MRDTSMEWWEVAPRRIQGASLRKRRAAHEQLKALLPERENHYISESDAEAARAELPNPEQFVTERCMNI